MAMLESTQRYLLHLVSRDAYSSPSPDIYERSFQNGLAEADKFFSRFHVDVEKELEGRSVLDVGCGRGAMCFYIAERGASKVTGVDVQDDRIDFANNKLDTEYPHLKDRVRFMLAKDLGDERFDLAVSKDSFEHYEDPSGALRLIHESLHEGGQMYLGFAPLWKSPAGGHISYVTWLPWAHLLFPEEIMFEERRRLIDDNVRKYSDLAGGLNQMTLKKLREIIRESDYTSTFLETNVSEDRRVKLFNVLKRIPCCEEYFTHNAYAILQK